ncbi:DUF4239 domain-containing protein [Paracidobacterium acidisoli]|uniref:bestrophin-like domain n=1 Tax=Paracidobacterium acidisoli TaxID=2303751 RepID=UPI0011C109EA|nr:DUF4239 domain-containing protein [Paracidobacterium acidisoli]MBT9330227.1 DUF4239 domain-containing protein [Paracidobacterium acidisoli]
MLLGLALLVELGLRTRRASGDLDAVQPFIESARDRLGVLLSLLLGFCLPMSLPHYEQRTQLVTDEANAIATVAQRAQMIPQPFQGRILQTLPAYVDARLEFAQVSLDGPAMTASVYRAEQLQQEMWHQAMMLIPQNVTPLTVPLVQAIGDLSNSIEQRQAAAEKHIPTVLWWVLILISALTCFVVGYSMRGRVLLGILVLPLTVAIVLSLVSELDNPRTGLVRVSQQSMLRLQQSLNAEPAPGR